EMEVKANEVRNKADDKAPKDQGYLRGQSKVDGKDLRWVIVALAEYSGYMEFGTKTKVNVPPKMREEADKFRNSGGSKKSYEQFKAAIAQWMRIKGIPEEALWPIMAKIMGAGIEPQPFMWPAFQEGTKGIEKYIDAVIQRYLDKQ